MVKQTALQWSKEMVELNHGHVPHDIYKQALQMEREQMIDAHVHGHNAPSSTIKQYDAQQYVNETYGGK